jgi:hypothetical protein
MMIHHTSLGISRSTINLHLGTIGWVIDHIYTLVGKVVNNPVDQTVN